MRQKRPGSPAARRPADKRVPPQQILDFIQASDAPAGKREIARAFGLKGEEKIALKALLRDMARRGADRRRARAAPSTRWAACPR